MAKSTEPAVSRELKHKTTILGTREDESVNTERNCIKRVRVRVMVTVNSNPTILIRTDK